MLACALLVCGFGCVERRMVIITHPFPEASGAIVFDEKNQPIGGTPADKTFTYYGKYRFRIVKDGYEPLVVEQRVRPPWYELPGFDFISENLIPWTIRDVRYFVYVLEKSPKRDPETLYQQGSRLREYGKTIGVSLPPASVSPVALSGIERVSWWLAGVSDAAPMSGVVPAVSPPTLRDP
jgi:hypothetical protein